VPRVTNPPPPPLLSKHFAGIAARRDAGTWKFGGATLAAPAGPDATAADLAFTGSTLIVVAASRAEVVAQLAGDVYAVEGVWDVEKVSLSAECCVLRAQSASAIGSGSEF
jgi:uncharacterized protein YciI